MFTSKNTQINAGSTADIAFLLLIFFLVTTTLETDEGIERKLPSKDKIVTQQIEERNLMLILINNEGEFMVNGEHSSLSQIKETAIQFIDNGSGIDHNRCEYCQGKGAINSSEHPKKATFSIQTDRQTKYKDYVSVQNELVAAYNNLRNREALRLYGETYTKMEKDFDMENSLSRKAALKHKLESIHNLYPLNISDAKPVE